MKGQVRTLGAIVFNVHHSDYVITFLVICKSRMILGLKSVWQSTGPIHPTRPK